MGRAKPKPTDQELPNRLADENPKRLKQALLADGAWGSERIPEIEEPAEEYRLAKKERGDTVLALKEVEDEKYELLKEAMTTHRKRLGPKQVYRYEDPGGDRQEVSRGEAKVTIKRVKPPKKSGEESDSEGQGFGDGAEPAELE